MVKKIAYNIQFLLVLLISFSVSAKEMVELDSSFYNVEMMDSLVNEYANQIKQQHENSKLVADGDLQFFINLLEPGALGVCDYSSYAATLNREINDLYNLNPKSFSYYVVTTNYSVFDRLMDKNAYKNALQEYLNSSQITIEGLKTFKQNITEKIINKFSNDLLLQLTFINDDTKVILDLVTVTTSMCGGAEATIRCNTRVDAHLYFDQRFPQDFVDNFWTIFNSQTTTFNRDTETQPDIILSSEQLCNLMMELLRTKIKVFTEMKKSNLDTYVSELQTTNDPLRIIEIVNKLFTDDVLKINKELRLRLVTILSKINLTESNKGEQAVLKLLINTDLNEQAGFMLAGIKENHILERLIYVVDDNASFSSGLYNPNYTKIIFTLYAYALVLDQRLVQNDPYQLIVNNKTFLWEGDGLTTFPGYSIKFNAQGNGFIVTYTNGTSINLDLFEPIGIISSVPLPAYNSQSAGSYYDIVVPAIYLQWLLQKKDMRNISQAGEVGVQVLSVVSGTGALLTTTSRVVKVLSVVEIASGLAGLADNLTDLRTVIHQKYGEPGTAFVDNVLFITNTISLFGAGTSLLNLETKLDNAIEFWMAKRNNIKVDVFADDVATYNQLDNLLKRNENIIIKLATKLTGRLKNLDEDLVLSGLNAVDDGTSIRYFSPDGNTLIAEMFNNDFRAYQWILNDANEGVVLVKQTREGYIIVKNGNEWGIDLGFKNGRTLTAEEVNDYLIEAKEARADGQPFLNGTVVTEKILKSGDEVYIVEYRYNRAGNEIPSPGGWGSDVQIYTIQELRDKLAVLTEWKNNATGELVVRKYKVKSDLRVRAGDIGPQWEDSDFGGIGYEGGSFQYEFIDELKFNGWEMYLDDPQIIQTLE